MAQAITPPTTKEATTKMTTKMIVLRVLAVKVPRMSEDGMTSIKFIGRSLSSSTIYAVRQNT
ncbi:hypothetical protein HK405_000334, partial [Cladochytrium tenue]